MEAIEFLQDLQRMCRFENCDKCPLSENECYCLASPANKDNNPQKLIEIVQTWKSQHPRNIDKLLEMFPGQFYVNNNTLYFNNSDMSLPESFWNQSFKEVE